MYLTVSRKLQKNLGHAGLHGWGDIISGVVSAVGTERATRAASKSAQADAAARIAEANANVKAAQLALQAEALKASSPNISASIPILLGGAAVFGVVLFFLVKSNKRRR